MLRIVFGPDWKANREQILLEISDDVNNRYGSRILIVPELVSHDTERRLAKAAGDTASRYAEVLTFSRLGRSVADEFSIGSLECLDNGGRIVAMAAAAKNVISRLKSYAGYLSRPEFLTGLLEAVDEFKRCCISSEDLRNASAMTDGILAQKLDELAIILDAYDSVTANGKRDPRDQTTWLLEQIEATDFAKKHIVYIDGFPDFTRQHMAILEHFIIESPIVTVSLNCDAPGSRKMAFEKAGQTALQLIRFAKEHGIAVELISPDVKMTPIHRVCARLYQGDLDQLENSSSCVRVFRAKSLYEECACAAQEVLSGVRNGERYRDYSVVCSDVAGYEDMLRMIFSRCGIPVYRSGTEDVLKRSVMDALIAALHASLNGFDQQDVIKFMKSVLSPVESDECDLLENYAILWGIRGSRWTRTFENHPEGLGKEWSDINRKELEKLESLRRTLIDPLLRLSNGFSSAESLKGQLKALCTFFEDINLLARLESISQEMITIGDNRSAQILNQLWDILLQAIDQLLDMLGDTQWDAESFVKLFTLLLSQYDVGTIPTVLDSVLIGSVSAMRCHQSKHLIVLGVREGALPGYNGSTGILTDREREALRRLDVPLTGGGTDGLRSEFAEIYGVFISATDSITVTCGAEQPSFIFNRLSALSGKTIEFRSDPVMLATDPTDAASILVSAGAENDAVSIGLLKPYQDLADRSSYELGTVAFENVKALYGEKLNLSASQIDKQSDCRFSYFMRYGIKAKEIKEAAVDPAEFGTYFHAVLEQTARRVMELGGFHRISLDETTDIAMGYSTQYIREHFGALESSRLTYLFERHAQELRCLIAELWQELSQSLFEPNQFELGFGDGKLFPAVEINGAAMPASIRGFVDRVDTWNDGKNNYFRVVDYKTGKKSFDYCDVFIGMGLQMLLYMFALEGSDSEAIGKQPIPAGVQYFSARFPYLQESCLVDEETVEQKRGKELVRKGLILADERVLAAMEPEGAPKRLAVAYTKDGSLSGDVADSRQFALLRKYVFKTLRKLVDEIASGRITPNPYTRGGSHDACRFCPYGSVCHKASVPERRNFMAMKSQRFWDEVEKEVRSDG